MRYVAFLRGINVGGHKKIKMEDLRLHFVMPGISNVVTYIQSGNVIFDAKETDMAKLRKKIEKQLADKLGYDVPVIIRSFEGIQAALAGNPYAKLKAGDTRKIYILYLSAKPEAAVSVLNPYISPGEEVQLVGEHLYIATEGIGNSKLVLGTIEKKLGVDATMRNVATSEKVLAL